jgi:AmmeMemoRadiSam system protein A
MVIMGPHGHVFSDAFTVQDGPYRGSLSAFGTGGEAMSVDRQDELAHLILQEALRRDLPVVALGASLRQRFKLTGGLDHGVLVPLLLLREQGLTLPTVILNPGGLSLVDHYRLGMAVGAAVEENGLRTVFVASGDLSHCLSEHSPLPCSPCGAEYDSYILEQLKSGRASPIVNIESRKLAESAQCGHRPLCVLLGALDEKEWQVAGISYEAPFGVGYAVVDFETAAYSKTSVYDDILYDRAHRAGAKRRQESPIVATARAAVEEYVRYGNTLTPSQSLELQTPAAVFVSIKKHGELRGCIGSTEPECESLGAEIVQKAIAASQRDPRFDPVEESELDDLEYSVDILSSLEPATMDGLDPSTYGVVVEWKGRRGVLLPDLPDINSVEQQVAVASRKAQIPAGQGVSLWRFKVTRHAL